MSTNKQINVSRVLGTKNVNRKRKVDWGGLRYMLFSRCAFNLCGVVGSLFLVLMMSSACGKIEAKDNVRSGSNTTVLRDTKNGIVEAMTKETKEYLEEQRKKKTPVPPRKTAAPPKQKAQSSTAKIPTADEIANAVAGKINPKMAAMSSDISSVKKDITSVKTDMNSVKNDVEGLKDKIRTLENQKAAQSTPVNEVASEPVQEVTPEPAPEVAPKLANNPNFQYAVKVVKQMTIDSIKEETAKDRVSSHGTLQDRIQTKFNALMKRINKKLVEYRDAERKQSSSVINFLSDAEWNMAISKGAHEGLEEYVYGIIYTKPYRSLVQAILTDIELNTQNLTPYDYWKQANDNTFVETDEEGNVIKFRENQLARYCGFFGATLITPFSGTRVGLDYLDSQIPSTLVGRKYNWVCRNFFWLVDLLPEGISWLGDYGQESTKDIWIFCHVMELLNKGVSLAHEVTGSLEAGEGNFLKTSSELSKNVIEKFVNSFGYMPRDLAISVPAVFCGRHFRTTLDPKTKGVFATSLLNDGTWKSRTKHGIVVVAIGGRITLITLGFCNLGGGGGNGGATGSASSSSANAGTVVIGPGVN